VTNTPRTQTREPSLLPLEEALAPYRGVSVRSARALIASGRLPAAKVGRAYLVAPDDLARLLAPVLRAPVGAQRGEGPNARADRQLASAGFDVSSSHTGRMGA